MKTGLAVLAVVLGAACATATYRGDLQTMCDSPTHATPGQTGLASVGAYLEANVKTGEGRELLAKLKEGGDIGQLRSEAAAHGLTSCLLVDLGH